jgi:Protein of unknown function (DUF3237)
MISMSYKGGRHEPPAIIKKIENGEIVDPASYYFRIAPMFETASPKYDWLNRIVAVGSGHRFTDGPLYSVFEVQWKLDVTAANPAVVAPSTSRAATSGFLAPRLRGGLRALAAEAARYVVTDRSNLRIGIDAAERYFRMQTFRMSKTRLDPALKDQDDRIRGRTRAERGLLEHRITQCWWRMVGGFLAAYGSGDVSWFSRDELRGDVRLRAANSALGERRYDVHFLTESLRSLWLMLERRHPNVVAVALANKNARIAWSLLSSDTIYDSKLSVGAA